MAKLTRPVTLPTELAAVEEAGKLLRSVGHPAGAAMLEWLACDCEGSTDFFNLARHGRKWPQEIKHWRSDELIREAAGLVSAESFEARVSIMTKAFVQYWRNDWPRVRGSEVCPHPDSSMKALFWKALHLWPHEKRRDKMRRVLEPQYGRETSRLP